MNMFLILDLINQEEVVVCSSMKTYRTTLRKDLALAESVFIEVEKCTLKKIYIKGNLS